MPDFHVKFQVTKAPEEQDVTGVDTREHAIDQIVNEQAVDGATVHVSQVGEIVPVAGATEQAPAA